MSPLIRIHREIYHRHPTLIDGGHATDTMCRITTHDGDTIRLTLPDPHTITVRYANHTGEMLSMSSFTALYASILSEQVIAHVDHILTQLSGSHGHDWERMLTHTGVDNAVGVWALVNTLIEVCDEATLDRIARAALITAMVDQ